MRNRPYGFEIYLENVKTIRTIAQIFVAFSKKLNFNRTLCGIMSIFGGYSQLLIYSIWHRIGHHSRRTLYKVTSSKSFFISLKGSVKFVFIPTKGQLISKCLFCVFNFLRKTNENKST